MFVDRHHPPYKVAGTVLLVVIAVAAALVYLQFRGDLADKARLTMLAPRAGLVVEPGAKVTYNGVEIGRVARIEMVDDEGAQKAKLTLDVDPRYIPAIPANVGAEIRATTVFGNKYISLSSPKDLSPQHITREGTIASSAVTTEFNTLFETVTSIAEQVDPIKLNQTLTAVADALAGLGNRFGESLLNGRSILDELNPQMPQIAEDNRRLADLADVYAGASPDLWTALEDAVRSAKAFDDHRADVDDALMAALGLGNDAADSFERGGPYLARGAADLIPTSKLLDDYRGQILCTIRNFAEIQPRAARVLGGNGYSLASASGTIAGAPNAYIYPDNLPRVNARGGPEGRPGCWQKITRELWPAPYLVMDTGASIAPYNHLELPSPLYVDYVWGRQVGQYTINP